MAQRKSFQLFSSEPTTKKADEMYVGSPKSASSFMSGSPLSSEKNFHEAMRKAREEAKEQEAKGEPPAAPNVTRKFSSSSNTQ